ncbi:MAG: alpha/beta hydrolase [Treponema sp.]|nr:alpha/beta hydrolase [Treponema sp.]
MSDWLGAICEVDGIDIHYTRTGGGKPPVMLLHGLAANGLTWTSVARALEGDYDVIMPDARGHGRSSAPAHGYRYDDHARDVVGLIRALGLHRPILVGHSMGGMTAALVAGRNPKLLRGLVLADPSFLTLKRQRELQSSDVAAQHRRTLDLSFDHVLADMRTRHPDRLPETLELLARARLQTSMSAFDVLTPPNPDYHDLAGTIDVPSQLIIAGSGVVTEAAATELERANPRFQVRQIREAGHGLHYDQPDSFAAIVTSFLHSIV